MRFLFIINPSSGKTSNDPAIELIKTAMSNTGFEFKFLTTTGSNDDQKITKELTRYKPDRVAACGGDGTVQLVARNLIGKKIPMGILPLGSANGMAKALDVPVTTAQALEIFIHTKKSVPLDLISINGHICIHLSDIGTNALLVKKYEDAGDKGKLGYAKHLIASIRESELMRYTITTKGETVEKEGYMLMIANANKFGTGVHISEGNVSDGRFEICNVGEIDLQTAVKAGLTALNIFVDKEMFSEVITCTEAEIKINRNVHLQIDGEYMGEVNTLKTTVIAAALSVLVKDA